MGSRPRWRFRLGMESLAVLCSLRDNKGPFCSMTGLPQENINQGKKGFLSICALFHKLERFKWMHFFKIKITVSTVGKDVIISGKVNLALCP